MPDREKGLRPGRESPGGGTSVTALLMVLVRIAGVLAMLGYPFAIWYALHLNEVRVAAVMVLAAGLVSAWRLRRRRGFAGLAAQVGGVTVISLLGAVMDEPLFLLQIPVLISLFMLASFGWTMVRPPTMIERYARLAHGSLMPGEAQYCSSVTLVWIAFFAVNAAVAEALAIFASVEVWAWYAGLIAYIIMGVLFTVEYAVRSRRFPRRNSGPGALVRWIATGSKRRKSA